MDDIASTPATREASITAPLKQEFDSHSTAENVLSEIDLHGRSAVVTGATSGIGWETARALASRSCSVIIVGRDETRGEDAVRRIHGRHPNSQVKFMLADLNSLASVKRLCDQLKHVNQPLHYLILNAGLFGVSFQLTEDGFESQFQVNHLSHMYMTLQLKSLLVASAPARVIVLSSESHRSASLSSANIADHRLSPPDAARYRNFVEYGNTKLCNILFVRALNKRWQSKGVTALAVHPGNMVATGLQRHWWVYRLVFELARPFTKSIEQGAATTVWAAVTPQLSQPEYAGSYLNNCWICEPSNAAKDRDFGEALWKTSLAMLSKAGYPADDV